ncbi:unnamed protein product [Boreogadus saida]
MEFRSDHDPQLSSRRWGVFVDYDMGLVSFYEVEARVHIYTATGCTFSQPLYPILGLGSIYDAVSSASLIISPVNQTN